MSDDVGVKDDLDRREQENEAKWQAALDEASQANESSGEQLRTFAALKTKYAEIKKKLESTERTYEKMKHNLKDNGRVLEWQISTYKKLLPIVEEREKIESEKRKLMGEAQDINTQPRYGAAGKDAPRPIANTRAGGGGASRERDQNNFGNNPGRVPAQQRSAGGGEEVLDKDSAVAVKPPGRLHRKSALDAGKTTSADRAPAPVKPARKLVSKPDPVIELLDSDDEDDADGTGLSDPHTSADRPKVTTRPTRSTVRQTIPQRIGQISVIYPPQLKAGATVGIDSAAAAAPAGAGAGVEAAGDAATATGGGVEVGLHGEREGGGGEDRSHDRCVASAAAGTSVIGGGSMGGGKLDTVEVTSRDLLTLEDGEFLNDSVIDFFIKKLRHEDMKPEDAARCHIFNSFFFQKLINVNKETERDDPADIKQKTAHERVRKWTRGVNIFEKDYVFFPIHSQLHWSVVILCHPGAINETEDVTGDFVPLGQRGRPYLLHLDSMTGGHKTGYVTSRLREYLAMEWQHLYPGRAPIGEQNDPQKNGTKLLHFEKHTLPHHRMKIPQQDNGCDCGLFLLLFMQRFITPSMPGQLSGVEVQAAFLNNDPPEGSKLPTGFLRKHWFVTEEAALLRQRITMLILEQLRESQRDPDEAREAGVAEATVEKYQRQRKSIECVMDEVRQRIRERETDVKRAEVELEKRRNKEAAAKLQKKAHEERRATEREGRREGKSAAVVNDGEDAANADMFYGTAGKGAERGEGNKNSKSRVPEDAIDSEQGQVNARVPERFEVKIVPKPTSGEEMRKSDGKRISPNKEKATGAMDNAEDDSEDDDTDSAPLSPPPCIQPALKTAAVAAANMQKAQKQTAGAKMVDKVDKAGKRKREGPTESLPTMRRTQATTHGYGHVTTADDAIDRAAGVNVVPSVVGTTAITGAPDRFDPNGRQSRVEKFGWENILSG